MRRKGVAQGDPSSTTYFERVWERWRPLPLKELYSCRRVQDGFAVLEILDPTSIPNHAEIISVGL
jgi:hypothetical protein